MRPVTPQPGYSAGDVTALIATGQFIYADCFTLILNNGDKWYYSSVQGGVNVFPLDGTITSVLFVADDVRLSGLKMRLQIGVDVDEQDLQISYTKNNLIYGQVWGAAVSGGMLDGAVVRRDRFFAPNWNPGGQPAWVGGVPMFVGRVANIDQIGRQDIHVKVKSYLVLGDISMPQEIMQPACRNTLFDARCTLLKASFAVTGAVGAGSNNITINWTGALAKFALGTISVVSGPSAGLSATIKSAVIGVSLTLSYPLPFEPGTGDVFEAFPGCDKTLTNCTSLGNDPVANHTGFPYTPPPMTAV